LKKQKDLSVMFKNIGKEVFVLNLLLVAKRDWILKSWFLSPL